MQVGLSGRGRHYERSSERYLGFEFRGVGGGLSGRGCSADYGSEHAQSGRYKLSRNPTTFTTLELKMREIMPDVEIPREA